MIRRAIFIVSLLLCGLAAVFGLLSYFQDSVRPPVPLPLEFRIDGEEGPELSIYSKETPLEVAGIRFTLPDGARIHPRSLRRTAEVLRFHSTWGEQSVHFAFFAKDDGIFSKAYREALKGPAPPPLQTMLFGEHPPMVSQRKQIQGGEVLRFDSKTSIEGQRQSLFVAIPNQGSGLGTVSIRYRFSPQAAIQVNQVMKRFGFLGSSTGAGSQENP